MAIRRAAVAGQFYSANPKALREEVDAYIENSRVEPAPERVVAILAPHAGYMYSGPSAGYAFARVQGKRPKRVIVMGRSHRYYFTGASVYDKGVFETPLGQMSVDEAFAKTLARETDSETTGPHQSEHCLEVELPFLQAAIGDVPIVPVLFGSEPDDWHFQLGRKLADLVDDSDLLVVSTDLSHYLSEDGANKIDKHSLDSVLSKDFRALASELVNETCSMCGGTAVVVAMAFALARGAEDWRLLHYSTSGAASGDYRQVVGYGAISMERAA